jgi:hypothetical protein
VGLNSKGGMPGEIRGFFYFVCGVWCTVDRVDKAAQAANTQLDSNHQGLEGRAATRGHLQAKQVSAQTHSNEIHWDQRLILAPKATHRRDQPKCLNQPPQLVSTCPPRSKTETTSDHLQNLGVPMAQTDTHSYYNPERNC